VEETIGSRHIDVPIQTSPGGKNMSLPITGAVRRDETILRLGGHGNDWHITWAADDSQLLALCDGSGWSNTRNDIFNSHLYRIIGGPAAARFEDLPGYPDLIDAHPRAVERPRYQGYATLAVDGEIYQFMTMFGVDPVSKGDGPAPDPRFGGAKLIYSPDGGDTWRNQDGSSPVRWELWDERNSSTMTFWDEPQGAFSLLSLVQMGRDYSANRDGYVYLYSPNGVTVDTLSELILARIPKNSIPDRSTYEYFAGHRLDGTAAWTSNIDYRGVVHTFPEGWVNSEGLSHSWQPSVTYNEPLGVFMMANWGHGCAVNGEEFSSPSYLGIYVAPNAWGPWTQIHEETAWTPHGDQAARAYQPQIAPKWIAEDGKSFWLVWSDFQTVGEAELAEAYRRISDDDTSNDERIALRASLRPYYAFNTQRVDLVTG
jgi:hypothetical protein